MISGSTRVSVRGSTWARVALAHTFAVRSSQPCRMVRTLSYIDDKVVLPFSSDSLCYPPDFAIPSLFNVRGKIGASNIMSSGIWPRH